MTDFCPIVPHNNMAGDWFIVNFHLIPTMIEILIYNTFSALSLLYYPLYSYCIISCQIFLHCIYGYLPSHSWYWHWYREIYQFFLGLSDSVTRFLSSSTSSIFSLLVRSWWYISCLLINEGDCFAIECFVIMHVQVKFAYLSFLMLLLYI